MPPTSKITGSSTTRLFTTKVLGKYPVSYWRCTETNFIQTDDPHWLEEAYADAITALDLGLVSRNIEKSKLTERFINRSMRTAQRFLDFGGGYGMFTRLMRDRGFHFLHHDQYCQNLFARDFAIDRLATDSINKFDLVTAWEVFEHVAEPRELLGRLLTISDAILFSTELVPDQKIETPDDWWYFIPTTGQHVSFYTEESFKRLASDFGVHFYSDGGANHTFSKEPLAKDPFDLQPKKWPRLRALMKKMGLGNQDEHLRGNRESLLPSDFSLALAKLNNES